LEFAELLFQLGHLIGAVALLGRFRLLARVGTFSLHRLQLINAEKQRIVLKHRLHEFLIVPRSRALNIRLSIALFHLRTHIVDKLNHAKKVQSCETPLVKHIPKSKRAQDNGSKTYPP
jgi:hypothetical protein